MYTIDGLRNGIKGCRKNIKVLEVAIDKEQQTIADYRIMIDDIERAEEAKEHAEANFHLEIVRDDDDTE
jgi:uncharacterized OsmC-like protein